MAVADRIDDRIAPSLLGQRGHRATDRRGALVHLGIGHQPDGAVGLPRQHAHQVGVGHRRQRMVLHAALVQQRPADEQMALVDAARIGRKRRAGQGKARSQRREQCIRHRSDIARLRAVEGRAVFEKELPAAGGAQPGQRGEAFLHRLARRRGARLQRHHHRIDVGHRFAGARHADELHRAHAVLHQHGGKVGGAGEIVGNAAQQHDGQSFDSSAAAKARACWSHDGRPRPVCHAASAMSRRSSAPKITRRSAFDSVS